jgi:hypothetical protein
MKKYKKLSLKKIKIAPINQLHNIHGGLGTLECPPDTVVCPTGPLTDCLSEQTDVKGSCMKTFDNTPTCRDTGLPTQTTRGTGSI